MEKIQLIAKIATIYPGVFFSLLGWWWAMSSLLESGNIAAFAAVGYAVPISVFVVAWSAYFARRNQGLQE